MRDLNYSFVLKFSAIRNLSDARYAAGSWADFIGFNFNPEHPAFIEPIKAKEISGWISGPMVVGEFGHQPIEWIKDFIQAIPLQAIQIPSDYPYPEIFDTPNIKFIIEVKDLAKGTHIERADMLICSDPEIYHALKISSDHPVIFENIHTDTDASLLDGVAFVGGSEDKPGTRNQAEWTDFLEKWAID